jgi:hypothetical protein
MHLFYVTLVDLKYFVYINGASPVERWVDFFLEQVVQWVIMETELLDALQSLELL